MNVSSTLPRDGKPGLADFVRCVTASTLPRFALNNRLSREVNPLSHASAVRFGPTDEALGNAIH
jgi:hypothetical protein